MDSFNNDEQLMQQQQLDANSVGFDYSGPGFGLGAGHGQLLVLDSAAEMTATPSSPSSPNQVPQQQRKHSHGATGSSSPSPSPSSKPKQACDFCRLRKRKCDGVKPVCGGCMKTAQKNRNAPDCTYSVRAPQNKNASDISKLSQAVLARLETIEALLGAAGGGGGDMETDGAPLAQRLMAFIERSDQVLSSASRVLPIDVDVQNNRQLPLSPPMSAKPRHSVVSSANSASASGICSPLTFHAPLMGVELEEHLLSLSSLFYTGYSANSNLYQITPVSRGSPMSENLKKAICFHASLFSTHPHLFNGNPNPTYNDRLAAMEHFQPNFPHESFFTTSMIGLMENQNACDEIRASLIHCLSLLSMAKIVDAFMIMCATMVKARMMGLFSPAIFSYSPTDEGTQSSDSILGSMIPKVTEAIGGLSEQQRQERIGLLAMAMNMDLFASVAKGTEFMIDETLFPDVDLLTDIDVDYFLDHASLHRKNTTSLLAANTIWQGTPFALMVDDALETKHLHENISSAMTHQRSLILYRTVKTYRKIVRFIRSNPAKSMSKEELAQRFLDLHNEAIFTIQQVSERWIAVRNLERFIPGVPFPEFEKGYYRIMSDHSQYVQLFLSSISYLHYSSFMSGLNIQFPLEYGNTERLYNSGDILMASFRALEYVSHMSFTPIYPQDSVFSTMGIYSEESLSQTFVSPMTAHLPSPMLMCPTAAVFTYLIANSAFSAFKGVPGRETDFSYCSDVIRSVFYPAVSRIGSVFPIASPIAGKLLDSLNGTTDDYWILQMNMLA